jgi:hypothetical protein
LLVFCFGLLRIFDIGDFYVVRIIQNLFSGKSLVELPVRDIDFFPTLGDTVLGVTAYALGILDIARIRGRGIVRKSCNNAHVQLRFFPTVRRASQAQFLDSFLSCNIC